MIFIATHDSFPIALVNRIEELGRELLEHNGLEELFVTGSLAFPSVVSHFQW